MYRTGSEEDGGVPFKTRVIFNSPVNMASKAHSSSTADPEVSICPRTMRSFGFAGAMLAQALSEKQVAASAIEWGTDTVSYSQQTPMSAMGRK